jgi:hypothetical protein
VTKAPTPHPVHIQTNKCTHMYTLPTTSHRHNPPHTDTEIHRHRDTDRQTDKQAQANTETHAQSHRRTAGTPSGQAPPPALEGGQHRLHQLPQPPPLPPRTRLTCAALPSHALASQSRPPPACTRVRLGRVRECACTRVRLYACTPTACTPTACTPTAGTPTACTRVHALGVN